MALESICVELSSQRLRTREGKGQLKSADDRLLVL